MPGPYLIDDDNVPNTACQWSQQRKIFRDFDGHFHCVYLKVVTVDIGRDHVFYGYSEDRGVTWETEDLVPGLAADTFYCNIVVDSNGDPHVVYMEKEPGKTYGGIKYLFRSNGSWSSPVTLYQGIKGNNRTGIFQLGEIIKGDVSGVEVVIDRYNTGGGGVIYIIPSGGSASPPFIVNEWVRGQDSGAKMRYQGDTALAQNISMAIDSEDGIHIAFYFQLPTSRVAYIDGRVGYWHFPDLIDTQLKWGTAIAVGPEGKKNIVVQYNTKFYFTSGARRNWTAKELFATGTSVVEDFSMAVDLDGNVHVAMAQTGLGGVNLGVLNIKYYKRTPAGAWSGPEHITEEALACTRPTIAVDKNGIISVFFLGKIGILTTSIFMRQKIEGTWGSIQALILRGLAQKEINSLCSLFPLEGNFRPSYPDGYAFIFNGRDEIIPGSPVYTVEFYHDIHQALAPPPTDLWCEQKTNPSDVQDPEPEFSAVYHETK